jgi:hypothetical protein
VRIFGLAFTGNVVRRRAQHTPVRRELAGDERAVLRHAEADRQVDVLLHEIRQRVRQRERERHFGVERVELVEPVHQQIAAEVRSRRHAHLAAHHALPGLERGFRVVQRLQRLAATVQIETAFVGEPQLAGRALEKPRLQAGFELGEARARGGGRETHFAARRGQTALLRGLDKEANVAEIIHRSLQMAFENASNATPIIKWPPRADNSFLENSCGAERRRKSCNWITRPSSRPISTRPAVSSSILPA